MCQGEAPSLVAAEVSMTEENKNYIRQAFLRGHLVPAFNPPTKICSRCQQSFTGTKTMCLHCLKAKYAEDVANRRDRATDTFLEQCVTCNQTTLHLGPGWCVTCHAASEAVFPVYCEECLIVVEVPVAVKDDKGGLVDMLKVNTLWCVECRGVADSWIRIDN